MVDLRGRDFLKLLDFTPTEINHLLKVAATLKKQKRNHESHRYLKDKQVALIFEKDSTRTRCAFEAGAVDLGMQATYIGPTGSQLGKKETIADTARVLCRMYDGIEYRGFDQTIVEDLAKYSSVPVWNGLTNEFHPTQMLADVLTVKEEFGEQPEEMALETVAAVEDLKAIQEKGKLVVGITDFEPMDYQSNGEWVGFDADLAKMVAEDLGVEVKFTEIDWDNKILELDSNSIDVVWNGMTLTDEVKKSMECTDPYLNNAQVVVVKSDKAADYKDESTNKRVLCSRFEHTNPFKSHFLSEIAP